jgi:cytochrome d ubiquinol oxidase subunit II
MDMNIFAIFSTASISGGIFLVALSVTAGAVWMKFHKLGDLSKKAFTFIKKYGVIYSLPLMFALVLMGINNNVVSIVTNQLFEANPYLLAIPLASLLSFMVVTVLAYFEKPKALYLFYVLGLLTFIATGFLGTFPYILFSNVGFSEGLSIQATMSSYFSLTVISVVLVIILPVVLLYQGQKYVYFLRKDVE